MPIELHERLSEFSYAYGVTREVEELLRDQGLKATPFLPSLLHEAKLGFDVGFDRPGTPLMLQFKLGQTMRRFVPTPGPTLQSPFWRYRIDTAERDGQFRLLLNAEQNGADVFYVAPRFHDWETYLEAFEKRHVVMNSLIVKPGAIRQTLNAHRVPDGEHKIVYDKSTAYLYSEPIELSHMSSSDFAEQLRAHVESRETSIGMVLEQVFEGFEDRAAIGRPRGSESRDDPDRIIVDLLSEVGGQPRLRQQRLDTLLGKGLSRYAAVALAVGAEAWASGAQLVFVTSER
jgi:hypothetical protein